MRLETSFASLQSPGDAYPYPLASCSSKSSMAGSLFSRSQLNSIMHADDGDYTGTRSTPMPSESTTVILSDHQNRGKSVAFDIRSPSCPSASSTSPNFLLKSILHRHVNGAAVDTKHAPMQTSMARSFQKLDLLNDDWYGRAPLASPETLSEISSISSRTSIALNLATSIENYLHRITATENGIGGGGFGRPIEPIVHESQMHTPVVMRRAPKITGNLSKCAEDWQLVEKYKRMGKVFVTNPIPSLISSSSDSSHGSFELTGSLTKAKCRKSTAVGTKNSHSVDSIDNDFGAAIVSTKLTWSDSAILDGCSSKCPKCPCKRSTGLKSGCCPKSDHSWCTDSDDQQNTSSTSDTYYSAVSSLATIDTMQMYANHTTNATTRLPLGVLESHFPVYGDANDSECTSLLPASQTRAKSSPKLFARPQNGNGTNMDGGFKRISREYERDRFIARNDSLPLLAGLVERSSPNSFNRRRNHAVYPMNSSPHHTPSKKVKAESNV